MSMYVILLILLLRCQRSLSESNDIAGKQIIKNISYYWNIPTFQCDSHKINFTVLAEKYNIIQNKNDRFRGDQIVILYDPGSFPALLTNNSKIVRRNGGVPQEGNLTLHLTLFKELVSKLIQEDFSGIGIIDFESWRPIFRQNFGTLAPYKEVSIEIERKRHPLRTDSFIKKEAKRRFEKYARIFMEETLRLIKILRPNSTWGYYAYPYCFNMAPLNMRKNCPAEVLKENDELEWLFSISDNFYPSLYFEEQLEPNEKIQMIQGRINEANRIANNVKAYENIPKIIPYFWYKYHGGKIFLTKEDLFNSIQTLTTYEVDGVVLWGSSNDVNTNKNCLALYDYIDQILGPTIAHFSQNNK